MSNHTRKIIFTILILLNCMTIFYFSNQIADDSGRQSSRVVGIILKLIPFINDRQEPDRTMIIETILTPIVRKMAHFSIYAMLGILTMNYMDTIEGKKTSKKAIYALMFCFLYAMTDEFHQYFIPGRSAEIRDVLIDSSGALMGILLTIGAIRIIKKVKNNIERKHVS